MTLERVVIAGGGTGGHVYPGVAIAEEVLRRNAAATVVFVGTARGMEAKIVPPLGYPLELITVSRLKGGGLLERLKGLFRLPVGIWQSWRLLRRHKPQVVVGVGGYASGPTLLAAWMTRRPTAIQEQNAAPGLTNRWLGKLARKVFVGFPAARASFADKKVMETGNPVRAALAARLSRAAESAAVSQGGGALRVLIVGGSQGARFLNENVPSLLAAVRAASPDLALTVVHQTGPADEEATRSRYASGPLAAAATVKPYIDDMPAAYAAADLVICRAGASTVAEITAIGLPSVLVPFPFAADDHQAKNAEALVAAGAARMVRQEAWREDELAAWLCAVAKDRSQLEAMSAHSKQLSRLDAAQQIVTTLEGIAR
ncbi:MAG: undecaprenyldiphospho-muramoylpentapeptide beta-N-acetylglucosaminyltransferase [Myxococcales bacterium]|nr:undecaprenyldiphospho-muramoylpentapeptide beta-N-acetylglucosaminyltransferase [Myxococcales bacterium]MCB9731341.1 undecaprenyldiphospho-muramoylpentapeptide beta-N-acetylglucosaminyltransferase [Deltaproteobacteria bacterium]